MLSWLFSEPLAPGTMAPDFTLSDQAGNRVTLSKLRGQNVVLVFYPLDNTPTCTTQLCEFRDEWPKVQKANTVVFGVNPGSAESHAGFAAKKSFPFPLLVDSGQEVASLYHANGPVVKRTVYLVGRDGRIRYAKRGKPSPEEVLESAAE